MRAHCLQQHVRPPRGSTQQDHHITPVHRPVAACSLIEHLHLRLHQPLQTQGDMLCLQRKALQLLRAVRSLLRRLLPAAGSLLADDDQLHRSRQRFSLGGRVAGPRMQSCCIIIEKLHSLRCHDLRKYEIDCRKHLGTTAEIPCEINAGTGITPLASFLIRSILLQEKRRVGQSKAIDALLHISHGKKVMRLRLHQQGQNGLLNPVDILVLIHHDLLIFFLQGKCRSSRKKLSRRRLLRTQYIECKMLQITEIHQRPLALGRREIISERMRERAELGYIGSCRTQIPQQLFLRDHKIFFLQILYSLFDILTRSRELFFQGILSSPRCRLHARKGHCLDCLLQLIPASMGANVDETGNPGALLLKIRPIRLKIQRIRQAKQPLILLLAE